MRSPARTAGFVLVEVCVAIILLLVCLLPVMGVAVSLSGRTARLDGRAGSLSAAGAAASSPDAADWTWGPRPGRITWVDGPLLRAELDACGADAADLIGVWVDGWFQGESSVEDASVVMLGAETSWRAAFGHEVVVRARRWDGAWGAPFRTVVPEPSVGGGGPVPGPEEPTNAASEAVLVVHLPSAAALELTVTSGGRLQEPVTASAPPSLAPPAAGPAEVSCCSVVQAWASTSSRALDVYF